MLSATHFKHVLWLLVAVTLALQWVALHISRLHLDLSGKRCPLGWVFFGAAFLLSWAAELAQKDLPQALAIAPLALIAVLPEILFALRAQPGTSMGALLSSKVNNGRV
jgi:hypothetical protein